MAQWSLADRTLYAKLVYYGPALGGKTTNLQALHRVTDPDGRARLVSVNTKDDRTLFFDLLPFELGSVLGYKVALKLYTVPGQVQYDATRRAVLSGADAVVFVADSDAAREADNRQSWDNLGQNMRAARLDRSVVPILAQINKRDLPSAAPAATVESWLGLAPGEGIPAVACLGQGVVETFLAASHAMLEGLVAMAEPATRKTLDVSDLRKQLDTAFAPYRARLDSGAGVVAHAAPTVPIILAGSDLLESAVAGSVALGAELVDQQSRAARLTREAESLRFLSDALRATGASFDRGTVVSAALTAVVETLGAAGAALCLVDARGRARIDAAAGRRSLAALVEDKSAAPLVARMLSGTSVSVVDDLAAETGGGAPAIAGLRAAAAVPVERFDRAWLLVAMPAPDGELTDDDVRFLGALAGHLAVGLEKVRIHDEITAHRDRLEDLVAERTRALRRAYDELKTVDGMKDRFLANVSHEMRSPLTAIIGAATFLKDYSGDHGEREEMLTTVLTSAESLDRLVDGLLRVARLEAAGETVFEEVAPAEVVADALRIAGAEGRTSVLLDPRIAACPADPARLATALGHLLSNALKFGPSSGRVELRVTPCVLARPVGAIAGVAFSVLDRGPGLADDEVERAFVPFEQGGHPMTGKPTGVGLGLYEARQIARRHGGTLIYLPRSGGGSEFRISLPMEMPVARPAREARHA